MTDIASLGIKVDSTQVKRGSRELDKFARSGAKADKSTKGLAASSVTLGRAVGAMVVAYGGLKLAGFIKDTAMLASRFETMGIVMRVAGNNAGYTMDQLTGFSKALQKSGISMLQSRNILTQLSVSQINLNKAALLGRAAQDVAVVGMINSSEALARMVHGIKTGRVLILRTLGLNVSFEASYKKLAAQLGVTTDSLDENQKMNARVSATLEQASRFQGIYTEAMKTSGKAVTSLVRHWEDFKVLLGSTFLEPFAALVFDTTDALKAMNTELKDTGAMEAMNIIGTALAHMFRFITRSIIILVAVATAQIKTLVNGFNTLWEAGKRLSEWDLSGAAKEFKDFATEVEAEANGLGALIDKLNVFGLRDPNKLGDNFLKEQSDRDFAFKQKNRISEGIAARERAALAEKELKAQELARKAAEKMAKKRTSFLASLAKEEFALGKTAAQMKVYEAGLVGIKGEQLKDVKVRAEAIDEYERQIEVIDDMQEAYAEATDVYLDYIFALGKDVKATNESIERTEFQISILKKTSQERERLLKLYDLEVEVKKKLIEMEGKVPDIQQAQIRGDIERLALKQELLINAEAELAVQEENWQKLSQFGIQAARNMQTAFADFLFDPFEKGLGGMASEFSKILRRMVAEAIAAKLMEAVFGKSGESGGGLFGALIGAAGSAIGGFFGGGAGAIGTAGGGTASMASQVAGFMGNLAGQGASFDGNAAKFARGGIVGNRTPFQFNDGGSTKNGVMGESGAEAIMPLERDASGNLGVKSASGGGNKIISNVTINVDSSSDKAEIHSLVKNAVEIGNKQLTDELQRRGALQA